MSKNERGNSCSSNTDVIAMSFFSSPIVVGFCKLLRKDLGELVSMMERDPGWKIHEGLLEGEGMFLSPASWEEIMLILTFVHYKKISPCGHAGFRPRH
jgi:hypothetical protein